MAEVAMQELEKKAAVYMLSRDDAIEASSLQLEQSSWSSSRWTLPQHSATELCWRKTLARPLHHLCARCTNSRTCSLTRALRRCSGCSNTSLE